MIISVSSMKKLVLLASTIILMVSQVSCSSDSSDFLALPEDAHTEDKASAENIYDVLEEFPAVEETFGAVDPEEFNDILDEVVNTDPGATEEVFNHVMPLIMTDSGDRGPLLVSLNRMTGLLDVIMNQDDYDTESFNYADGMYGFFDSFSYSESSLSNDLFPIVRKALSYMLETYDSASIDAVVQDLQDFLVDETGVQTFRDVFTDISVGLGKILLRANSYDSSGNRVGNAVSGIDQIFSALNIFSGDTEGRQKFYTILRELGDMTAISIDDQSYPGGKKYLKDIIRELVISGSSLFIGGTSYNPGPSYKSSSPYVNAELKNSIRELYPSLVQLFLRSDRPDSIIRNEGNGVYALESIGKHLKRLDIDVTSSAVDTSLYDMVRYDGYGRDRILNSNANGLTYLENLLYTVLAANYTGFLTRMSTSGEPSSNHNRGHGTATGGILTLNDCLYSMGNGTHNDPLGGSHNAYSLCLDDRLEQALTIYRSSSPFHYNNRGDHFFYMGYDLPALSLLSGNGAGDAGIPNGGEKAKVPTSNNTVVGTNNDFRTYFPKVMDGIGELNTSRWVMGWIARACWKGEGPYYSSQGATDNGNGTYTYYSPDGQVYATVNKNSSTWSYSYPSNQEHYKAQWNTDYFMIKARSHDDERLDDDKRYFAPNRVYDDGGDDRFRLARRGQSCTNRFLGICTNYDPHPRVAYAQNGGALTYTEKIAENDHSRECATQEEAMFKNYQWLMGEKKFVFVIPMFASVEKCSVVVFSAIYTIVECNGILGVSNVRKGSANNRWVIKGNEGTDIYRNHGVTSRYGGSPNYGDSHEFGDSRITALVKEDEDDLLGIGDAVTIGVIWNEILQGGRMLPNVIGINFGPIQRMAFVKNEGTVTSSQAGIGSAHWNNRNRLFPTIVSLLGELRDKTEYIPASSGHDYNYSGNHKYPLKLATDGLLPPLSKPLFRRFGDSGGRWVPRILANGLSETSSRFLARGQSDNFYKPRGELLTTIGMLSESARKKCDGLIPGIAKTELLSGILDLLKYYGDSAYDDPAGYDNNDYATWGARKKFFYGLEQIFSSIRTTRGEAIQNGYYGVNYPSWIFSKNDRHLDLDYILDEAIGTYETNGKGLAGMIFRRNQSGDWANYNRLMDALPALLSTGGQYNVMENAISLLDTLLTSGNPTDDQLKGIRHTLGMLLYRYDSSAGQWKAGTELLDMLTTDFPAICDTYRQDGGSVANLLTFFQNLMREDGFIPYMVSKVGTSDTTEQLMQELYDLMSSPMFADPNTFWMDFANLLMKAEDETYTVASASAASVYPGLLFTDMTASEVESPYEDLAGYDPVSGTVDKYVILGELLSKEKYSIFNK